MSKEVPGYWLPGLDRIRATFTLCTTRFQYLSIITRFLVETNFIPPKRVYPGLSNCYCIISSPYDIAMLVKSLTQQGEFAFPFANAPTGSYRWNISALAFLCIRSHEGQITYMRLRYTCTCRKAIHPRHSVFFFLSEALCHLHCTVFHRILNFEPSSVV